METTYKVITIYQFGQVYIEHFKTFEEATAEYNKTIKNECDICYLLETERQFQYSGDSCNKILSEYRAD